MGQMIEDELSKCNNKEPKYWIGCKLTTKCLDKYLMKYNNDINHLEWSCRLGKNTEFTQKEIDKIKEKYKTDLKDFDIVPIETYPVIEIKE